MNKKVLINIVTCVALLLSAASYANAEQPTHVRVKIIAEAKSLEINIAQPYKIEDAVTKRTLGQGRNLKANVRSDKDGFLIGNLHYKGRKLLLRTDGAGEIMIDGRRFRGDIQLNKSDDPLFSVINHIELEEYIKGVLYHEASHYWPDEVLKAQAIVSRTFALSQIRDNAKSDFDVTSDTYSQVYGGSTSERHRTNRAVESTKGAVLAYEGKIFPAYFHATCGGHTEDAAQLWKIKIPPLKGVACNFCKNSPHQGWHAVIPENDFRWSLRKGGFKIKKLNKIEVAATDDSGRVTEVKLIEKEKETKIPAKDIRQFVGPNVIKSTIFSVSLAGEDVVFEGVGWGHGVGMCQWGAYFMAKQGYTYQEIAAYYYPGSVITSVSSLP
jgi:stage II sporulation protein D